MKKNVNAALRRQEKWAQKNKKEAKVLTILSIVMAVLAVVLGVVWMTSYMHKIQTRDLSTEEMNALFRSKEALPDKDDTMVGDWYFYNDDRIVSKYVLDAHGNMQVYDWTEDGYVLNSSAVYRVREKAGKLYVRPEGDSEIVTYTYTIEENTKDKGVYLMYWTYENQKWGLVKLVNND